MMRQTERQARFEAALEQMPCWETWTTEHSDPDDNEVLRVRQHVKLIPRRVRRDMARQRSKREYRAARGLEEPR